MIRCIIRPACGSRTVRQAARFGLAAAWCLSVAAVVGCGRQGPAVNMVEGVVTLDGEPLEGVTVTFVPTTPGALHAVGRTQSDGAFRLNTVRGGKPGAGAMLGDYVVTALKSEGGDYVVPDRDASGRQLTDEEVQAALQVAQQKPPPPVKYIVPKAYGSPETSNLKVTVKKGRNTGSEFRFDLRSDFKGSSGR